MTRFEVSNTIRVNNHCNDDATNKRVDNGVVVAKKVPSMMTPRERSFTEIEKLYSLNNQLLEVFDHYYTAAVDTGGDSGHYQVAYTVGLQFVETALLEIPQHGYYHSTKKSSTDQRLRSTKDAYHVTQLLQKMLTRDTEEVNNKKNSKESLRRVQKLAWLANEHQRSAVSRYPIPPAAGAVLTDSEPQLVLRSPTATINDKDAQPRSLFCDLTSYSDFISRICPVSLDEYYSDKKFDDVNTPTMQLNPSSASSNLQSIPNLERVSAHSETSSSSTSSNMELNRVLHLSGLQIYQHQSQSPTPPPISSRVDDNTNYVRDLEICTREMDSPTSPLSIGQTSTALMSENRKMAQHYHGRFSELRNKRQNNGIQIYKIPTFQGRIPGSINGCTVIAPLLCISFFNEAHNGSSKDGLGLSDEAIEHVIDVMTPTLLPRVRGHLGLCKDAFIVPSDVHDYLIDHNYLSTCQFVNVVGGNIFDDDHLNELIASLTQDSPQSSSLHGKRIGATLFFLEHVVAIHRLQRVVTSSFNNSSSCVTNCSSRSREIQNQVIQSDEEVFFELIDSLPHEGTFQQFYHHPYAVGEHNRPSVQHEEQYSARMRCYDVTSFKVMLRWYAYSKLSDQNFSYMDQYSWDNAKTDFDPRVFQAFVWSSMN